MTALSPLLKPLLERELALGNSIASEHQDAFQRCPLLVVMARPFNRLHVLPEGVREFANHDSHYPLGVGYQDIETGHILQAPFL